MILRKFYVANACSYILYNAVHVYSFIFYQYSNWSLYIPVCSTGARSAYILRKDLNNRAYTPLQCG